MVRTKMNLLFLSLLGFVAMNLSAQYQDEYLQRLTQGDAIKAENFLESEKEFNFSPLWLETKNEAVFGIIGEDHQRIRIKLIQIIKSDTSAIHYQVRGKSMVKRNVCDFEGYIRLTDIFHMRKKHFGPDEIYADSNIQKQGVIVAEYYFEENENQSHSGIFQGKLYTKWYLNEKGKICYDKIELHADRYFNNAFIGTWNMHNSDISKICHWGDYRVPYCRADFDIGVALFSPSEKYHDKGWANYNKAWLHGMPSAMEEERRKWWK